MAAPAALGAWPATAAEVELTEDEGASASRWLRPLQVSQEDVARIRAAPQRSSTGRASADWLRSRRHRLTASRFYKALEAVSGECLPGDARLCREQLIEDMLVQPEALRSPKRFGLANEARARQSYIGYRVHGQDEGFRKAFRVEEIGLCVWQEEPWLAASPDGVVSECGSVGALEIKCCKSASHMYSVDNIPRQFYDQMQGEMVILSIV